MADTYLSMYAALRLQCPDLPIFLAQQFIRDRYRRIAERRNWSGLRGEGEFLLNNANIQGSVNATRNSATIVGVGTAFASTDVGRQFMAGNRAPVYTVLTVDPIGQTLTIDRVFGGDSVTNSPYFILDAYQTAPADFKSFLVIYDPKQNWRLRHWVTQDDIARLDPARTSVGTPWAFIDRRFTTAGLVQFEVWPYSQSQRNYPFYYFKQVPDLVNDTDTPFWPIRGDVIVKGALADVARWPGTVQRPNPMYNAYLSLAKSYEAEFEDLLVEVERQDENIYLSWLSDAQWNSWPYAPFDSRFMQNHAMS